MAAWVSVLFVLGLTDNLQDICNLKNDATGIMLEEEDLPKRIRRPLWAAKSPRQLPYSPIPFLISSGVSPSMF
jgi:hypothetical protein